jgi:tetratricopeptide (TPR) repeat protein
MRAFLLSCAIILSLFPVTPQCFAALDVNSLAESLRDREFEGALELIEGEKPSDENADYVEYLRGNALSGLEKWEEALEAFESLIREFPKSKWLVKAEYRRAECLAALHRFQEAEAIYCRGAEGTLAEDRRREIAEIYIHHADRFFKPGLRKDLKPGDPVPEPDYGRALNLYRRAAEIVTSGTTSERLRYQIGFCLRETGQLDEAASAYEALLEDYRKESIEPQTDSVPGATEIPNYYHAGGYYDRVWLDLGNLYLAMGHHDRARRTLSEFISVRREETEHLEYVSQAAYQLAKTFQMPGPPDANSLSRGVACLERFIEEFPESPDVPKAAVEIADGYFHREEYEAALEA